MAVGGSRQETLNPGFVLLGTPINLLSKPLLLSSYIYSIKTYLQIKYFGDNLKKLGMNLQTENSFNV
ncbi:unnamed protein product [Schistosoma margrebowiei]|uniref:Uncharacterized protein n=1 Tax=Schistosoma margrebowiei TaxID=48269 RepID=A0A183MTW8_9TREM|nr:unnamed protein product [Schistosoma margrebowiei]